MTASRIDPTLGSSIVFREDPRDIERKERAASLWLIALVDPENSKRIRKLREAKKIVPPTPPSLRQDFKAWLAQLPSPYTEKLTHDDKVFIQETILEHHLYNAKVGRRVLKLSEEGCDRFATVPPNAFKLWHRRSIAHAELCTTGSWKDGHGPLKVPTLPDWQLGRYIANDRLLWPECSEHYQCCENKWPPGELVWHIVALEVVCWAYETAHADKQQQRDAEMQMERVQLSAAAVTTATTATTSTTTTYGHLQDGSVNSGANNNNAADAEEKKHP